MLKNQGHPIITRNSASENVFIWFCSQFNMAFKRLLTCGKYRKEERIASLTRKEKPKDGPSARKSIYHLPLN